MIIIEGPDNSGKTILAGKLISNILGNIIHHSGGPIKSEEEMHKRMQILFLLDQNTIFDRVPFISERIYGPITRDVDYFKGSLYLPDFLKDKRPLIIYCRPPIKVLRDNHQPGDYDTPEHFQRVELKYFEIIQAYDKLMLDIPHINYNWQSSSPDLIKLLVDYCILWQSNV